MRKGCLCTHNDTAAATYFDCAALIHGIDAPGMPAVRPEVALPPAPKDTPPPMKPPRGRPPSAVGMAKRQRRLEMELAKEGESHTLSLDTGQMLASPDALMLLFAEEIDENNLFSNVEPQASQNLMTVDLLCDEDPEEAMADNVKKRVRWTGLPAEPPEWVAGRRRKVPRMWEPGVHVAMMDGLLCLRDHKADESRIKTMPTFGVDVVWK